MSQLPLEILEEWSVKGHRTALGESLVILAKENPKLCTITADLTPTARLTQFKDTYPDRFFDVGIAEQNLIAFTAGLAIEGIEPVAVGLAAIVPMRPAEQMRMALGYMNLNATVVSIEAGVRFGPLGNTHFGMDDMAVMRAIPNFTIISPSDPFQIYKALEAGIKHPGPVYIRLTGGPGFPVIYSQDFDFKIGKAIEHTSGKDVAIITTGSMLGEALKAEKELKDQKISARVIDMHTVKPLDKNILDSVFSENSLIVTMEEHSSEGGLGAAVAQYKSTFEKSPKQIMLSLGDTFQKTGGYDYILSDRGLTKNNLIQVIKENL